MSGENEKKKKVLENIRNIWDFPSPSVMCPGDLNGSPPPFLLSILNVTCFRRFASFLCQTRFLSFSWVVFFAQHSTPPQIPCLELLSCGASADPVGLEKCPLFSCYCKDSLFLFWFCLTWHIGLWFY